MSGQQIATSVTILNSLSGYQALSLTNFITSAQSLVAQGSKVEIAGAFYRFPSNDTPSASSWTAVGTGNVAYIVVTPSGSAGVQILTTEYSDAAPIWSTTKQGWYASAGSLTRYIGGVTKGSATQYDDAFILYGEQEATPGNLTITGVIIMNGVGLKYKVVDIGDWDMNFDAAVVIAHGLGDKDVIRSVSVLIKNDADNSVYSLFTNTETVSGSIGFIDDTEIQLERTAAGFFDDAAFETPPGGKRGWVTIWYSP